MYPRTVYEMTEEDLEKISNAYNPTSVIQENANRAWAELGRRMGFDYMTVRPMQNNGPRFFTAIPSETENQRKERETKEIEEKRIKRITEIIQEITTRAQELGELGGRR